MYSKCKIMKLQRGSCTFCLENNKVVTSEDAEGFLDLLPNILPEQSLNIDEFNKIKHNLKICVICCQKLCIANTAKSNVEEFGDNFNSCCGFCQKEVHVIEVESDWKYFQERSDCLKYSSLSRKLLRVCLDCLFYIDTVFNMKIRLFTKFPQVKSKDVTSSAPTTQRRSRAVSPPLLSPPSAKRNKISTSTPTTGGNCFSILKPLSSSSYNINKALYNDAKLYKKIAYVDITRDAKRTPISKIKIRLRTPSKKKQKRSAINKSEQHHLHNTSSLNGGGEDHLTKSILKKRPYVKIDKSTLESDQKPTPKKRNSNRQNSPPMEVPETPDIKSDDIEIVDTPKSTNISKRRRSSIVNEGDENDEQIASEETPKTSIPPRRRSSIFTNSLENGEIIDQEEPMNDHVNEETDEVIESESTNNADKNNDDEQEEKQQEPETQIISDDSSNHSDTDNEENEKNIEEKRSKDSDDDDDDADDGGGGVREDEDEDEREENGVAEAHSPEESQYESQRAEENRNDDEENFENNCESEMNSENNGDESLSLLCDIANKSIDSEANSSERKKKRVTFSFSEDYE